ncbi:MAG: T9SS type A sorting domain-containing protein [Prevotella sp.]|nr:T9SS type A sorting domain-containing protein [Prevotella sp.]
MTKTLLTIVFSSVLLLGNPMTMQAGNAIEIIENDFQEISITVEGNVLHVTGAQGEVVKIYNVAGVCVQNYKVDGPDKYINLDLTKGCYIVKVGKTVRKISIK